MMSAEVGDDVFKFDPSVNLLQQKAAEMFGMEEALFFPSGTMSNQVAIKIHSQPGDRMFCDKWAHVYNYEGGGAAFNSGVTSCLIDGQRGMFTAEQLADLLTEKNDIHTPFNRLVCVENTTNKGGGACWDFDELIKIKNVVNKHQLAYHLDGARLFNAIVAKNETPYQYGELFDTISICLSKGLGAPVGSLLLGRKKHIESAVRIRKLFGGGMRQVGYLAAAGLFALENNIKRLIEDHQRAKLIGEVLNSCSYVKKVEPIETNIVIFYIEDSIDINEFITKMQKKHILLISMGHRKLRIVTHLDFTDNMLERLINQLKGY